MARTYMGVDQLDTNRRPSDNVWRGAPILEYLVGQKGGFFDFDDFATMTAAGTNAALSKYKVVGTNGTAVLLASDDGGVIRCFTNTTANNESYLCYGQAVGAVGQLTINTPNEWWFEARVRYQDIVNSGTFVGFTRPADMASGFIVNGATAMIASSADYFGFSQYQGTPTALNIVYNTAGTETVYKANAQVIATNTWYKLGIRFGSQFDSNLVRFYINGKEVANTAGTLGVAANATNFPSAVKVAPIFAAKTSGTTSANLEIDWWRLCTVIDDQ